MHILSAMIGITQRFAHKVCRLEDFNKTTHCDLVSAQLDEQCFSLWIVAPCASSLLRHAPFTGSSSMPIPVELGKGVVFTGALLSWTQATRVNRQLKFLMPNIYRSVREDVDHVRLQPHLPHLLRVPRVVGHLVSSVPCVLHPSQLLELGFRAGDVNRFLLWLREFVVAVRVGDEPSPLITAPALSLVSREVRVVEALLAERADLRARRPALLMQSFEA